MKNEIDLIDFWRLLWRGKFFIIFFSFIFLLMGFVANYNYKPIISYKTSLYVKELSYSKLIPLIRINEAVKSITDHYNYVFDKIDYDLLDSNLDNYIKNIIRPSQLGKDFLFELQSTEEKINGLIELEIIEKGDMATKEYNIKLKDIATSDDFLIWHHGDYIEIEKGFKSTSDELKYEKYLDWLIINANKNVNIILKNAIEEIIKKLEDRIEIEENEIYDEIELFSEFISDKKIKTKINKYFKEKNLLAIRMLINEYYFKNISNEDLNGNLDMEKLNYLNQKILYIEWNRTKFLISNLQKIYYLSGINDLRFKTMIYDPYSNKTVKLIAYKPNYPLIGFLLGFLISVVLVIIKFSFLDLNKYKK